MTLLVGIRADASRAIGYGHVSRCIALAETLGHRGCRVRFIARAMPPAQIERIRMLGHEVSMLAGSVAGTDGAPWMLPPEDAQQTAEVLDAAGGVDWLVVDHYGVDAAWERAVRDRCRKLMWIDDLLARSSICDLVLNQNLVPQAAQRYEVLVSSDCRVLVGPAFALLGSAFRRKAPARLAPTPSGRARRMMVFFGGGDANGLTLRALEAAGPMFDRGLKADVVVGGAASHLLQPLGELARRFPIEIHVDTPDMVTVMARADFAVGAGGTTAWERCALGLPCVVVAVAGNQIESSCRLAEAGASLYLGRAEEVSQAALGNAMELLENNAPLRAALSAQAAKLVDGLGCDRVARELLRPEIQVRPAEPEDARTVFPWRNDVEIRRHSVDVRPLDLEDHLAWFGKALSDPSRRLLIGEVDGRPFGVLRYDLAAEGAEVSIYVDPSLHGRGLGPALLRAGERWLRLELPLIQRVSALVLQENAASRHAFEAAGFDSAGSIFVRQVGEQSGGSALISRPRPLDQRLLEAAGTAGGWKQ